MKIKKILLNLSTILIPSFIFLLSSCSFSDNIINFVLSHSSNNGNANEFIDDIKEYYYEKIDTSNEYKNLAKKEIKIKQMVNDENAKKNLIENGTADFSFLKVSTILNTKNYANYYEPLIQTLTTPFSFDTNLNSYYVDGTENDPLRKIAHKINEVSFNIAPFNQWHSMPNIFIWDGVKYQNFYDMKIEKTPLYRGMIVISGDDEKQKKAKQYWDEKNWNNFRDMGLIVGESSSFGIYKLQETLIKKHFNLDKNFSLISDKQEHPDKYLVDSYGTDSFCKENGKFAIGFTDEGSFAWNKSSPNSQTFKPFGNGKISVLTVTDPMLYDIGVFSNNLNEKEKKLLSEAIVATNTKNNYSMGLGYNDMKIIKDFQKEVIDIHNKIYE